MCICQSRGQNSFPEGCWNQPGSTDSFKEMCGAIGENMETNIGLLAKAIRARHYQVLPRLCQNRADADLKMSRGSQYGGEKVANTEGKKLPIGRGKNCQSGGDKIQIERTVLQIWRQSGGDKIANREGTKLPIGRGQNCQYGQGNNCPGRKGSLAPFIGCFRHLA